MADKPLDLEFDAAAARADGVADADIAAFLADRVGFDLAAARNDGVSDTAIVDFLAPERAPAAPEVESRGTWGSDLKAGLSGTSQGMAATVAVRAAQEVEDLKKQIETFKQGEPDLPEQLRHLAPQRQRQVPLLEKKLAEAEKRYAGALSEQAQDAEALKALPTNEPMQRFVGGDLGEVLKNPGAVARGLIGQSATAMVPLIVGVALGGPTGGALAGGAVGAATGGGQEAVRILTERKIDARDAEAVKRALADPEIKAEIDRAFGIGQAIESTVGAATGGLGGVTVPAKTTLGAVAKNVGMQAAGQGAISATGEAAKQGAIEGEMHPGKIAAAGLSEALFAPADVAGAAFHARRAPTPEAAAEPVLQAETVDDAIAVAREVVDLPALEETAVQTAEFGNRAEQDQAAVNRLFGGLNDGEVERAADGAWFYRSGDGKEMQLQPWDGRPREDTIAPALAEAQRAHYEQQGVRVVYFENDAAIPFDGAVDPAQPNTIFLSNKPDRNAAQVGAHEITHVFESTTLPDGTNLGDLLQQQVAAGITAEGRAYAERLFGQTAPKREAFPEGADGDSLHADAVTTHLIRELGADIGGEAPKFQTFMPRVIDAVQSRYGADTAKQVMQKLIAGIRQAMTTLRQFFFKPEDMAELGQPATESQKWVNNLDQIHGTLAQMYAQRFGTTAGLAEQAPTQPQPVAQAAPAPAQQPVPVPVQPAPIAAAPVVAPAPVDLPIPARQAPAPTQLAHEQAVVSAMQQRRQARVDKERGQLAVQRQAAGEIGQQTIEARETTNTEPTDGQKDAGNYLKGRVSFHGLPFVMENPKGSTRSGVDGDGKRWEATLPADYGYLSRTEGADGDQVDAYIGPHADSQRVWVIDQIDPKTGRFDEHKVVLGTRSVTEARAIYHRAFSDGTGPQRIGAISEMSLDQFKGWLQDGDTKSPAGKIEPKAEPTPVEKAQAEKPTFAVEDVRARRTDESEASFGKFRGVASTNEGGRLAVHAYGETAAEAQKNAVDKLKTEFDARKERRTAEQAKVAAMKTKAESEPARAKEATPEKPGGFDQDLAEAVASRIGKADQLTAKQLQQLADHFYGGSLGSGAYTRDRFYDAIELGVNRFIQKHPERFDPTVDAAKAKDVAADLAALKASLPTQTVRAGEKDAYQQFSTPPDYAYAANWVANLNTSDHVLEPSAGVGGLIVHAMNAGVRETTVNELSEKRRGMITALEPTRVTGEDAAQLNNILPDDVRPTVVVMNPPFSRAAERMGGKMVADEGAKHIEQALARLEPGGRLVAIVGDGMKPEGTVTEGYTRDRGKGGGGAFRDWWGKIGAEYDVRANVGVDRDIYTKYGTSFPTRFLVIDKLPPSGRPMVTGQVPDAAGLIDRLQEVRNDRGSIEQVAGQPGRAEVAGRAGPGAELSRPTGDMGTGAGRGERAAPAVTEPARPAQPGERDRGAAGEGRGEREPVVPVESEPADRGAGGEPRAGTGRGDEPAGSSADRSADGIRQDGSGEREQPGITPASEDVLATEAAVSKPDSKGISEAIYEPYKPQRVNIVGAKAHPGALVQSAAMASVMPPKTDYKPRLPQSLVKTGALSDAQLEAITYAGHAHSDVMADGKRRGFFIGDGTGVGKGREIAGILLDNKQNGRTKAVWISEKRALLNDARRDWNGLGQPATEIFDHGKVKAGEPLKLNKGVLFTTYDTLKSAEQTKVDGEKVRGKSRVDQIVDWVGKDFDGVIAFDESHNLGNATDEKGNRGVKKAAQKALAGVELQNKLPNARVVYVSATGATEVSNLAYADRLGLWGEGTPFPDRREFVAKVSEGGMAAMELVARDMKAMGHYIARNLSYDGVQYERVEHKLSSDQRAIYDKLAEGWQTVLQNFNAALEMTGATQDGKTLNGKAKSAILSAFWGGHQRFFNQVITSMQMPSVIKAVEKDLKAGRQSVLQLVNTMEAAQERALEKAKAKDGGELEDLDLTPRDQLMQMVEKSFPVQQMEQYTDDNGNLRSRPAVNSKGEPVLNKEAVRARDRLLDELGSIRVPDGPLEMLMNHFGPDKVAEVTGRGQRVVRKPDETGQIKPQVEKRGAQANVADSADFQAGKKPILIFSEAGGTGRSYHAEIGSGSEKARRSHYLVQGGWRADKAVQGFGRTHRTSQASAPIFNLVTTDLQGQKRFISSIARRLGQLGALTKGERRTGDQGMFGMRDNLESGEAKAALREFFHDVAYGRAEGIDMDMLERGMGLKMRDENGGLRSDLPEMSQFLNRVLSLKIDDQNRVFDAFSDRLDGVIAKAAAAGTLDAGVETYKADKISKVSEQTVFTDPRSGAETKHVHLNAQTRNNPASFEDTVAGRNKTGGKKPDHFVQNERSGNVFAVTEAGTKTLENGNVVEQLRLTSPTDYQFVERSALKGENWKRLSSAEARPLWDEKVASTPEFRNSDLHVITGAVLPIWDRLGGHPKIYRLQTADGERMLGRVIPSSRVDDTLQRLGAEGVKISGTPAEISERILKGATATLANEWTIKPARVAGERRIELKGPNYTHAEELKRHGVFSERIAYETRYFIPTGEGAPKAIEAITKSRPITSLSDREGGPAFSPRLTGENPNRPYTPEQLESFKRVGRAVETTTMRDKIDDAREDIGRKLIANTVDSFVGLRKNDPTGYMAARLANSVAGAQEVFRLYGTLKFDGATYNYKDLNGGVRDLVKSLGPEAHDFLWWVAANRAERLKAEDRENLFSHEDIRNLKELNRGEIEADYKMPNGTVTRRREAAYVDALRRYDILNKSVLDLVVESGLVKRETVDELWADPFYVPFYREAAEEGTSRMIGTPGFVKQYASKKLKGGSDKLRNDLWENAFGNWDHMIDAALRNRAATQILETASRLGAAEPVTTQDFNHRMTKAEMAETTWTMVDGKQQQWRVTDPLTFKAVSALETVARPGPIMTVARAFARGLRYGVTANPLFAFRNLVRDTENAMAVSQISVNPAKNLADGFSRADVGDRVKNLARAMAGKEREVGDLSPDAISAMAGGALMRLGTANDAGVPKTDLRNLLDTPNKLQAFGRYIAEVAGAYKDALASGEDVNRLALYSQLREQGAPHDFASFSGRDLQDFTLRGAAPFVRTITDITPFLNARMQGLYRLGRSASDADKSIAMAVGGKVARGVVIKTFAVLGAMTVASLALDAIYEDDEDYQKRTEFDRQTYYWFRIGDAQFRIPKGFELAALSSLAADGISAFFGKEMTGERLANNFWTTLGTNLQVQAPAIIQPVIDLSTNTRGTGGPIETRSMERLAPEARYTGETTLIARGLSSSINAGLRTIAPKADGPSPVQLDYLAGAYGAWLATSVLGVADKMARAASDEPEKPGKDFWAQTTQGLVRTESAPQSRYVDMLYSQGQAIEEAYNTYRDLVKRGRMEEAKEYLGDNKEKILKNKLFQRVIRTEAQLNEQIRAVTNSSSLSGEQKKVRIMQLTQQKNRAARSLFAPEARP